MMKDIDNKKTDTPIFDYCRKLIKEGIDSKVSLEVWGPSLVDKTKDVYIMRVEVGAGAKLTVDQETTTFALYRPFPNRRFSRDGSAVHSLKSEEATQVAPNI